MKTFRTLSLVLGVLLNLLAQAESFAGRVVGISDGDTIRVLRDGAEAKVRLHGVDCPESNQDFGSRARQFTSEACFGETVTVEVRDTDRYGRIVGQVTLPTGQVLNHELVRNGLAWWYQQYAPGDRTLSALEAEARAAKSGLWSMPNPVAPWDFRRGGAPSASGNPPPTASTPRASSPAPSPVAPTTGVTVYVTTTGQKYHADGCRYLAKSKIPMALDVATGTYGPCSVCNPPVANAVAPGTAPSPMPAQRGPPAAAAPAASEDVADTVYATRTGAKYHASGCRYLKSVIPMSRSQAQGRGLTPCSVCRP